MTILNEAANIYSIIRVNNDISRDKIKNLFVNCDDRSLNNIVNFYKLILDTNIINDVAKIFVMSNAKYDIVARSFNSKFSKEIEIGKRKEKDTDNVKADIYYSNKKVNDLFKCNYNDVSTNLFHLTVTGEIDVENIVNFSNILNNSLLKFESREAKGEIRKILVNIPKVDLETSLGQSDFDNYMEVLMPYMPVVRSSVQRKINNNKKEAGYIRFLLNTDDGLSDLDMSRKEYLMSLISSDDSKKMNKIYDEQIAEYDKNISKCEDRIKEYSENKDGFNDKLIKTYASLGKSVIKSVKEKNINVDDIANESINTAIELKKIQDQIVTCDEGIRIQREEIDRIKHKRENRVNRLIKNKVADSIKKAKAKYIENEIMESDLVSFKSRNMFIVNNEIVSSEILDSIKVSDIESE